MLCYALLCFAYPIVLGIIRGEILHNLVIIVCCGGAETKETDFVDCISLHCPIHQHCRCRFCLVNVLLCPTNRIIATSLLLCFLSFLCLDRDRAPCLVWVCQEASSMLLIAALLIFANVGLGSVKLRPFYETYQQILQDLFLPVYCSLLP